ncbi:hypothetical protein BH24CHL10_BH24CHL10_06930 [soil metagenome]
MAVPAAAKSGGALLLVPGTSASAAVRKAVRLNPSRLVLLGGYSLRSHVATDLKPMADAARAAGLPVQIVSAYRSYSTQKATFDHWVAVGGYEQALRTSARPGALGASARHHL